MLAIIYGCGTDRPDAGDGQVNIGGDKCGQDGMTRDCHVPITTTANLRVCKHGQQVCTGGTWSACGAVGTTTIEGVNLGGGRDGELGELTNASIPHGAGPMSPLNHSTPPFPPTGFPACPAAKGAVAGNACDCTGAPLTCGLLCNGTANCNGTSRLAKIADFECNGVANCDFHCSVGSVCNILCNGTASCNVTCPVGSICNVQCVGSGCNLNCGLGACNVTNCTGSTPAGCPVSPFPAVPLDAGPGGAGCNPCDPYCQGANNDAGLNLDATMDLNQIGPLTATPPGFEAKLIRDTGHCEKYPTNSAGSARGSIACQADFFCRKHCDSFACVNERRCEKFTDNPDPVLGTHAGQVATGALVSCYNAAPDLTLGSPCRLPGNQVSVAICNRGSASVPAGTGIALSVMAPGGILPTTQPSTAPTAAAPTDQTGCPTYPVDCTHTLTQDLDPGYCTRVTETQCPGFNGNKVVFVNSNLGVTECMLRSHLNDGPQSRHGPGGFNPEGPFPNPTLAGEQQFQLGCGNNYHAWNSSQLPLCPLPYEPKVYTFAATAVCPPGTGGEWNTLGWEGTTPSNTEILFEVRVQDQLYDGGVGPWTPYQLVGHASANPPRAPAVCVTGMGAPGTSPTSNVCPKDLLEMLGSVAAKYENLELRITMNPSTPSATQAPTLTNYFLTYRCVPNE